VETGLGVPGGWCAGGAGVGVLGGSSGRVMPCGACGTAGAGAGAPESGAGATGGAETGAGTATGTETEGRRGATVRGGRRNAGGAFRRGRTRGGSLTGPVTWGTDAAARITGVVTGATPGAARLPEAGCAPGLGR